MSKRKYKLVKGDRFVICRWSIVHGPFIEDSSDNLGYLLSKIPDHLNEVDDDRLSICEVTRWVVEVDGDPSDWKPARDHIHTLYEIDHYSDPQEDEEAA